MVENHLLELFREHNRVIIPDLGAFICSRKEDKTTINFNDFLKFNDGILINHLIKVEKISKTEAQELVGSFVKNIEKNLREQNQVEIPGIGLFYKDDKASVCFVGEFTDSSDLNPIQPAPSAKTVEEPILTLDQSIPVETHNTETKKQPIPVSYLKTPTANNQIPTKKKTNQYPSNVNKKYMQNSVKIIIIASVALVVIAGGIFGLIYFDVIKAESLLFWKKKTEIVQAPIVAPQIVEAPPAPEPVPTPEQQVVDLKNKYHVVAGSFKVENNAIKFNEKLKGQGFQSNIIGPRNGYFIVTYATFENKNEAIAEYGKRKQDQTAVWVLHY